MFLFKVRQLALVFVIMFYGANVRVLGFLPDLQGWVLFGSPQSTLCAVGRMCGCRQGSSRGSSNGSSPPATWDMLYEAAGEVERTIGFELVWKGKKPNRTEINRFESVFGSVQKIKKKSVLLFILVQNRTEPEMFSPSFYSNTTFSILVYGG
jgi:hypothetical protein